MKDMKEQQPLARRQAAVLAAIKRFIAKHGYPPTIRDLMAATGGKSPHGVDGHLDSLEAKGWITRTRNVSRGIRVL